MFKAQIFESIKSHCVQFWPNLSEKIEIDQIKSAFVSNNQEQTNVDVEEISQKLTISRIRTDWYSIFWKFWRLKAWPFKSIGFLKGRAFEKTGLLKTRACEARVFKIRAFKNTGFQKMEFSKTWHFRSWRLGIRVSRTLRLLKIRDSVKPSFGHNRV